MSATREFRVGVLGLGRIGSEVARHLSYAGYAVSGWDANARDHEDVTCFCGEETIGEFLRDNDLVVNCLPLTVSTDQFINNRLFATIRQGVFFINISRGAVVCNADLIDAINSGHVAAAALDTFSVEPLPENHDFWAHRNVHITPHVSGATFANSAVDLITRNLRRIKSGLEPYPLYDRGLGF